MLEFNFNWQKLSVSAGVTLRNFYFRLYPGAIGELEVIDFLKALLRHIDGPLLIVWDRLPAHRSRLVREFIELSQGHIATEFLPPGSFLNYPLKSLGLASGRVVQCKMILNGGSVSNTR